MEGVSERERETISICLHFFLALPPQHSLSLSPSLTSHQHAKPILCPNKCIPPQNVQWAKCKRQKKTIFLPKNLHFHSFMHQKEGRQHHQHDDDHDDDYADDDDDHHHHHHQHEQQRQYHIPIILGEQNRGMLKLELDYFLLLFLSP